MTITHTQVLIVGAGVSGLSSAQILKEKGVTHLVLEQAHKPGGLIKCDTVNGHLFHRVGGHVFNTKVEKVNKWFWSHFDQNHEFINARREAAIFMHDQLLGYPLENHLYRFDEDTVRKIFNEIMDLDRKGYQSPHVYDNFEAFLQGNFGHTLYELYFKPYNHKIWKTDLSLVALPWLDGKLPMPNYREMVISNILRSGEQQMVHSSFFYPKHNGSQHIADRLSAHVHLQTDMPVKSIEKTASHWVVNGNIKTEAIIYTGDVRKLASMMHGVTNDLKDLAGQLTTLKSNGTSNLLCETDPCNLSWLYLPEAQTQAHRIIYTGNFSPSNQPVNSRKSCTVEFSGEVPVSMMEHQLSLLPGNLKMIDYNYEPNSYVIQQKGDRDKINELKAKLRPQNFFLVGRFAEWEYHNMDKAIESAMNTVSQIEL
ncbi:MAG: NAD(P)-binding protein [Breznakibacter sp.]